MLIFDSLYRIFSFDKIYIDVYVLFLMVDLSSEVDDVELKPPIRDINYIAEREVVQIMRKGDRFSLPYACILRHNNERVFARVKPHWDTDRDSLEPLTVKMGDGGNMEDYIIGETNRSIYGKWHYRNLTRKTVVLN